MNTTKLKTKGSEKFKDETCAQTAALSESDDRTQGVSSMNYQPLPYGSRGTVIGTDRRADLGRMFLQMLSYQKLREENEE
jgi:hypothetical protein